MINNNIKYMIIACVVGIAVAYMQETSQEAKIYERYIAIDGACGWPTISKLSDGGLMCFFWPNPNHGVSEGSAQVWRSDDDGRSWKYHSTPVSHKPTENLMLMAAGFNNSGEYMVMVGGHSGRRFPPGLDQSTLPTKEISQYHFRHSETLPTPAVYKTDPAGWENLPVVDTLEPEGTVGVPYGRIAPISESEIGVFIYHSRVRFYVSNDNGTTWQLRGELPDEKDYPISFNETAWIKLENGDLYAASRRSNLIGFRSTDNGYTWTREDTLTMHGQHPADLTRLEDGRVLLTYGIRNKGMAGIAYIVGDPVAKNWSKPTMLVSIQDGVDLGYPSTVESTLGQLVTAYYVSRTVEHYRYHVAVVRWEL